jgi:hypothetical protein
LDITHGRYRRIRQPFRFRQHLPRTAVRKKRTARAGLRSGGLNSATGNALGNGRTPASRPVSWGKSGRCAPPIVPAHVQNDESGGRAKAPQPATAGGIRSYPFRPAQKRRRPAKDWVLPFAQRLHPLFRGLPGPRNWPLDFDADSGKTGHAPEFAHPNHRVDRAREPGPQRRLCLPLLTGRTLPRNLPQRSGAMPSARAPEHAFSKTGGLASRGIGRPHGGRVGHGAGGAHMGSPAQCRAGLSACPRWVRPHSSALQRARHCTRRKAAPPGAANLALVVCDKVER